MSLSITIGSLVLDDSYAPTVSLSYEHFTTPGQVIIGGIQKYSISGTVNLSSSDGLTGATVMAKLKNVRDLGQTTSCIDVIIPNFYTGRAKIVNVNIEQGSDPSWVSQGKFSIELIAPISNIPSNTLGITANDFVTDLSMNETLELGEDSHNGYLIVDGAVLSKQFVKFQNKIELSCKNVCASTNNSNRVFDLLKRLISIGPTNKIFDKYKTWKPYLQSRSLEITNGGDSISFSSDIILIPPTIINPAYIDIDLEHTANYESKQETKKISGSIQGLTSVSWRDIITIDNTSSANKYNSALLAFNSIKSIFNNVDRWGSIGITLLQYNNCPITTTSSIGRCGSATQENIKCFLPMSSIFSTSKTDGTINFTFEWSTQEFGNNCTGNDGFKTDISVDITEPTASVIEHIVPRYGTLIQNLNCATARKLTFTMSVTNNSDGCSTVPRTCSAADYSKFYETIESYIGATGVGWLKTEDSTTTTYNSLVVKQTYIQQCV